ncbi:MAG: hypothetical protein CMK46_02395 [Porticoccus sp.]|jgi:predicted Co/Zn/Cd cation transporter (cation efflux family)|nr:hypothetical protein [Porticoccus sp.]MBG57118.1 hypothetical protein [Porticoccus sp.]|tara:strand:- start:249 stop:545 length:297 start_codon:yes stop_codon:yes gene_type:complete
MIMTNRNQQDTAPETATEVDSRQDEAEETKPKNLSALEIITQAFCLVFALQRRRGMKRASDLLETNPKSVILAGIMAMVIFFSICFIASQLVIRHLVP